MSETVNEKLSQKTQHISNSQNHSQKRCASILGDFFYYYFYIRPDIWQCDGKFILYNNATKRAPGLGTRSTPHGWRSSNGPLPTTPSTGVPAWPIHFPLDIKITHGWTVESGESFVLKKNTNKCPHSKIFAKKSVKKNFGTALRNVVM